MTAKKKSGKNSGPVGGPPCAGRKARSDSHIPPAGPVVREKHFEECVKYRSAEGPPGSDARGIEAIFRVRANHAWSRLQERNAWDRDELRDTIKRGLMLQLKTCLYGRIAGIVARDGYDMLKDTDSSPLVRERMRAFLDKLTEELHNPTLTGLGGIGQ